jgi:hypothetical protein
MNNSYNSPNAMISRGLNPFVQGSAAMAGSKSPASGGAAASAAPPPSVQAFRPDFSDVGSALASMAQARAAMLNAEQNEILTPYKIDQIRGATDYRNISIGESGYWNSSTGRRSALLDQSKEYQEQYAFRSAPLRGFLRYHRISLSRCVRCGRRIGR